MAVLDQSDEDYSDSIEAVLEKVSAALHMDVIIEDAEDDWINFRVQGMTDRSAAAQIDLKKHEIFGPSLGDYPIRYSSTTPNGEGLWIKEPATENRFEYRHGVWQY